MGLFTLSGYKHERKQSQTKHSLRMYLKHEYISVVFNIESYMTMTEIWCKHFTAPYLRMVCVLCEKVSEVIHHLSHKISSHQTA